jgi:hypothetical protein
VNVVEFDNVADGLARSEILNGTNRYATVEQIVHMIVNDFAPGIVANENTDRFHGETAALADLVISTGDPLAVGSLWHGRFSLNTALSQFA